MSSKRSQMDKRRGKNRRVFGNFGRKIMSRFGHGPNYYDRGPQVPQGYATGQQYRQGAPPQMRGGGVPMPRGPGYERRAAPLGGYNFTRTTYTGALTAFVALVLAVCAVAMPYWVEVKNNNPDDKAHIGLWNNCTGDEYLCVSYERQDVHDWLWSCRVLGIIAPIASFVVLALYFSLYFRDIDEDSQCDHLYYAFLMSPLAGAIELVVVVVFGVYFSDIDELLSISNNISVNLYVCFYLGIVSIVFSVLCACCCFMDYQSRTEENALRRAVGHGDNFTTMLYWALGCAVLQTLFALLAIGLPMYAKITIEVTGADDQEIRYGQWQLCLGDDIKDEDCTKYDKDEVPDWLWGSRMTSLFGLIISAMYLMLIMMIHKSESMDPYSVAQRLYYAIPTSAFAAILTVCGYAIFVSEWEDEYVKDSTQDLNAYSSRLDASFYLSLISSVAGACAFIVTIMEYRKFRFGPGAGQPEKRPYPTGGSYGVDNFHKGGHSSYSDSSYEPRKGPHTVMRTGDYGYQQPPPYRPGGWAGYARN